VAEHGMAHQSSTHFGVVGALVRST